MTSLNKSSAIDIKFVKKVDLKSCLQLIECWKWCHSIQKTVLVGFSERWERMCGHDKSD